MCVGVPFFPFTFLCKLFFSKLYCVQPHLSLVWTACMKPKLTSLRINGSVSFTKPEHKKILRLFGALPQIPSVHVNGIADLVSNSPIIWSHSWYPMARHITSCKIIYISTYSGVMWMTQPWSSGGRQCSVLIDKLEKLGYWEIVNWEWFDYIFNSAKVSF